MPTITDNEFGTIVLRKSARARSIRIRVAPNGTLRISTPLYTPLVFVKRLINKSRPSLRELLKSHDETSLTYGDGEQIGKSHRIVVQTASTLSVSREKQSIIVELPTDYTLNDASVRETLRPVVIDALRLEAKSYLPKRLAYLAERYGFYYQRVRFSHAGSRWGSCSTSGTISLNIALMKLPFELIDYVLIHELAHTQEMNHSTRFWELVEKADAAYKDHRRTLKKESPSL